MVQKNREVLAFFVREENELRSVISFLSQKTKIEKVLFFVLTDVSQRRIKATISKFNMTFGRDGRP